MRSRGRLTVQVALASGQSLREIQESWTDEDLVTVLQELEDHRRQEGGRRGR